MIFVVRGGVGGGETSQPKSLRGGRTTSMMSMTDLNGAYTGGPLGGAASNGAAPGIFQRFIGGTPK
jgi:hypothetical protein